MSGPPPGESLAVLVARDGRLPGGAADAASEAGRRAVVVGTGAADAAAALAADAWWWDPGSWLGPAALGAALGIALADAGTLVLPASPDGRDLAPRLSAQMGRPLLAEALCVRVGAEGCHAELLRVEGRVLVPVSSAGPAVATLVVQRPVQEVATSAGEPHPWTPAPVAAVGVADTETLSVVEPDPATMDLRDARRIVAGGAGLAAGLDDSEAKQIFELLGRVAARLNASAGATRVATDAGWTGYERQIGTTGVGVDPELYVALGISGATQHTAGLGSPAHVVSVNTDPSCPMTAMANLGVVADAREVLRSLASRLGVNE